MSNRGVALLLKGCLCVVDEVVKRPGGTGGGGVDGKSWELGGGEQCR